MANYIFNPADYADGTSLDSIGWTQRFTTETDPWKILEVEPGLKVIRYDGSAASARRAISWDVIDADAGRADCEMLLVGRRVGTSAADFRMMVRGAGADNASMSMYIPGAQHLGSVYAAFGGYSGGSVLGGFTNIAVTPGISNSTWFACRARVNGTTISVKIWLPANAADPTADEPAEWSGVATNSVVSAAGWVGLFRYEHADHDIRALAYATGGDTATFAAPSSTPVAFAGSVANQTGTEGTAFSLDLSTYFSGTETPFAYSVQAGTIPAGLSLNSSTGVISGTPTTAGVSSGIVIRATDATPDTADTNGFSITINAANTSPSFTGPNIADISGTEGVALTPVDVSARFFDSESGLTFSAVGSWPAGVTVSSAGVISGTPTTAGTYASLQVRATDAGSLTADSNAFTITVAAAAIPSINVTDPLKNNTGTVLASQSGVRVAVLQAADLVSVFETSGLTTNGSGILATISDASITAGQQYHVAIKLADGSVGITGPITAS